MKITKENIEAWLLDLSEGNLTAEQEKQVRAFLRQHPELDLDADRIAETPGIYPSYAEEQNWDSLKKTKGWERLEKEKEDFLIGKLEGTLTPQEEQELNNRLINDAQLAAAWEEYRLLKLQANENDTSGLTAFLTFTDLVITEKNYASFFIIAAETRDNVLLEQAENWMKAHPSSRAEWKIVNQLTLSPSLRVRMPFKEKLKKRETRVAVLYSRRWYTGIAAAAAVVILFMGWNWFNATPAEVETASNEKPGNKNEIEKNQSSEKENNHSGVTPFPLTQHNNTLANRIHPNRVNDQQPEQKDSSGQFIQPDNHIAVKKDDVKDTLTKVPGEQYTFVTKDAFYKDSIPAISKTIRYVDPNPNFTTMKNVVNRVSKGFIEVDRKKDQESKEFYLRIGNWKFHRKKKLGDQ